MSVLESDRPHFVYWLTVAGEIVYVGRSIAPKARWRIFQKRVCEEAALHEVREFSTFEAAAEFERSEILRIRPKYNKYVASSPSRLGMRNRPEHTAALIKGLRHTPHTVESGKKRWEHRDRSPEKASFYGKQHTESTKERIREATRQQFMDPVKKEKHRAATVASIALRKAQGKPLGRPPKKLKENLK